MLARPGELAGALREDPEQVVRLRERRFVVDGLGELEGRARELERSLVAASPMSCEAPVSLEA